MAVVSDQTPNRARAWKALGAMSIESMPVFFAARFLADAFIALA